MKLNRTTLTLPEKERKEFIADVPQSIQVEGYTYIREDIVQEALKIKFENSEN